ncbi:MAG TPA: hypothetical protein VFY03_06090 [Woeseiaceae bacterium]|nr:hypothetical protein [Woeseiaceae bacterium]
MVAVLRVEPHFEVPARSPEKSAAAEGPARLALADRISSLSGIRTVENGSDTLPSSVTVYLANEHGPARKRTPPVTLCVISRDGLTIHGLSLHERRHLVMRGWGVLDHHRVRIFLPRYEEEVDVCWRILQHAHCSLLNVSARSPGTRRAIVGNLPRFSRTTLQ